MAKKKRSYIKAPKIPTDVQHRYEVVLKVLNGEMSVSAGAKELGLSRPRFQTLLHRGMEGLVDGISPQPPGRPRRPEQVQALMDENEQLSHENERLHRDLEISQRMMGVVTDVLHGRVRLKGQSSSKKRKRSSRTKTKSRTEDSSDEDQDVRLEGAEEMLVMGVNKTLAAATVGRSRATLYRWQERRRRGEQLAYRRGPGRRRPPTPWMRRHVIAHFHEMNGHIGADALSRHTPGVSRRQADAIKKAELIRMERERKKNAIRVWVTEPGVIRGFDGMHVRTIFGKRHALIAADACVPFRTTTEQAERYTGHAVAGILERDIEKHGAPLAFRFDWAKSHGTAEVNDVLDYHQVLVLHGPPRMPRFYGQLERQNLEHRQWLEPLGELDPDQLDHELARMTHAFNNVLPRRMLGWRTAGKVWAQRRKLPVDRVLLRQEVQERAARLRDRVDLRGRAADFPERLAIQQALIHRGLLHIQHGGRC